MRQTPAGSPLGSVLIWALPILACALALSLPGGGAAIGAQEDGPIYMSTEVQPPVRARYVEPDYPDELKRARIEGHVDLEIVVGRSGAVEDVRIIRSNPAFDEAAVKAVKQWKFKPALLRGNPVKVFMTVVVQFKVEGGLPTETLPIYVTPDIKPPERIVFVPPDYPEQARKDETEGQVVIQIVVNTAGDVDGDRVVKSDPLFDDAALLAIRQWKYKPALKDGKPVKVYFTVDVDFKLK